MAASFEEIIADPVFHKLPLEERRKVLKTVDPAFAGLAAGEQERAMYGIAKRFHSGAIQAPQDSVQIPAGMTSAHSPQMQPAHQPEEPWTSKLAGVRESILGPDSNISAKGIAPYYRTGLEGGGAAAGAIAGTPAGPAGMAAGGGLGYAAGKTLADRMDEALGVQRQRTVVDKYLDPVGNYMQRGSTAEVVTRPVRDTVAGIAMAGPAEGIARGVGKGVDLTKRGYDWIASKFRTPAFSGREAEKRVGEYLAANTSEGPIYARNVEEAQKIEDLINAGVKEGEPRFKFTLAQQSGGPNLIKTERSAVLPQGQAADTMKLREAENSEALSNFWQRNFKGKEGATDVLEASAKQREAAQAQLSSAEARAQAESKNLPRMAPEDTGGAIIDELSEAVRPVKATMNELEAQIPNYPIKLDNLRTQLTLMKKDPKLNIDQRRALQAFEENDLPALIAEGENTFSAMGISRTLGDRAAKLKKAGEKDIAYVFDRLKSEGVQEDINALSELARTGKLVERNGKIIDTDKLAAELERGLEALAKQKQASAVDVEAMQKAIHKKHGYLPMRVVHEGDQQFEERIIKEYQKKIGGDLPMKKVTSEAVDKALEYRIAEIRKTLSEVSPGQDVGAAMSAYNKYSREQYFGRFDKGGVKDALRRGDEAAGTRLKIEDIPKQFKGASGSTDLIRAVGEERARELMRGNLSYDLLESVTDPATGKVVTQKLNNWLATNKVTLEKYGMAGEFTGLQNAQKAVDAAANAAVEYKESILGKLTGQDPGRIVESIINSKSTAADTAKLIKQLEGNKEAISGLKNAFGEYLIGKAETTWPKTAGGYTVSQAQVTRLMRKSMEAARVLYKDEPAKIEALQVIQRAYEIAARTSRSPTTSNSDTAEKVSNILNNMVGTVVGSSTKVQAAKAFWNYFKKIGQERMDNVLSKAIFDPEYAYTLVRGAKGTFDPKTIETTINNKIIRLEDVRRNKLMQTALGTEAAASGEN